ncbi:lipopolysaccharide biosynthesis protein [Microbacterium memoriense]|uniref:Polysaccharide biosynthesis protein n=1 Tax=Microbacterium memoriense TaxID=2978350 RepID=A0ABT2PB32_9MICO|nr:hypothetical protein [Microbacterium memoriense]MCT9001815.1 hypothetical protein [Microbacterium memoriense]
MLNLAKRLASFTALPFLSLLVPLVALPVVARVGGVDGWSALAIGQAIGSYAAAVAFVGWNVLGTPLVAVAASVSDRRELYRRSIYVRSLVLVLVAPLAALIASSIAPAETRHVAAIFAVGAALSALGIAWYAVGISSPATIALYELLPRAVVTAVAVPLVLLTGEVMIYALSLIVAPLAGLVAFHQRNFGRVWPRWPGWVVVRAGLLGRKAAWSVEITGNLYANAPVPVAAALGDPADAASYSSGDRLYRYSLYAVVAFGNALQGWVLEVIGEQRRRRNIFAICAMTALGVCGGVALALLGRWLTALLFGQAVAVESITMLWLGIAFTSVAISTALIRNILMPARMDRAVLITTLISAFLGVATMLIAVLWWGASGVAAGLALSEFVTLTTCAALAYRVGLVPHAGERRGHSDLGEGEG